MAKFITTAEAAERNDVTVRYVQRLCKAGEIAGAQSFGDVWMIPASFTWAPRKRGPKPKKGKKPAGR
jgi:excisionase family DNA binding protein